MKQTTWNISLVAVISMISICPPPLAADDPVRPGDAAVGLGVSNMDDTIELVGVGGMLKADSWNNFELVESVEFDNTGGILHNFAGNLLGARWGDPDAGGSLYQYPAPSTGLGTAMIEAGTDNDTAAVIGSTTSLTGVGVSFNNNRVSVMDWHLGEISVLNYNAAGSSVSLFANTSGSLLQPFETQGTTWIGNSSVEAMSSIGDVLSYEAANKALQETLRLNVTGVVAATGEIVPAFEGAITDIEYNPNIADVIITSAGIFSDGKTTSLIFAIDPNTNELLDIVDLSQSVATPREISWTPEGDLIVTQFAGAVGLAVLDILPNYAGTIGTFSDNASLDYYTPSVGSVFNGVDVTFGSATIVPEQLNVFRGIQIGGKLEDVFESDDSRIRFNPGPIINPTEAPVWLIFDATLLSDNPGSLEIVMESQAGAPGLAHTLEAWNWTSMAYDVVDVSAASFNSDTIVTVDLSSGISDYVESGTGAVRTRVGWRKTGPTINFPWEVRLDQMVWIVQ